MKLYELIVLIERVTKLKQSIENYEAHPMIQSATTLGKTLRKERDQAKCELKMLNEMEIK